MFLIIAVASIFTLTTLPSVIPTTKFCQCLGKLMYGMIRSADCIERSDKRTRMTRKRGALCCSPQSDDGSLLQS